MTESFKTHNNKLITCRKCPRMVAWREEVARTKRKAYQDQVYWGKPVPGFGDTDAKIMIVGLAPGAHGSNRTGRMFTGDASGDFLYPALYRAGFANQAAADHIGDELKLKDVFITAICRCVPPNNRPYVAEIKNCLPWMEKEVDLLPNLQGFVALGKIAFDGILRMYKMQNIELPKLEFGHNEFYELGQGLPWLLSSYHPSQQNTLTGRLTEDMFDEIWVKAKEEISY
ncbi:MAG: uracil-DNA glycosylase [Brevefilum sp.]|nr:uracil-DNA glycosylase [Brevefilum sp.]